MSSVQTLWQPADLIVVTMGTLVFFFCFGFALWKALSASQATIYWHVTLCISWLGIILTAIAGSRTVVWTTALNVGYGMLGAGIIMTLAGIFYLMLHHIAMYRDNDHHAG